MLKIGLVGVGGISTTHINAWEEMEDVTLEALCDVRSERLDMYPEKRGYLDLDEMLEKEELDILDICLPTYLHVEVAIKAMEKGLHVICEKPISLNAEDVERVYAVAQKQNVKFMVAQVVRFWPEYELLKNIYLTKKYGKVLSGYMGRVGKIPKWSYDNWMRDEKRSGLVPFDLHIHDLDFMVYTFGAPQKTSCHRTKRSDQDSLNVVYEYPGFYIGAEATWYAAHYPFHVSYRFQFEKAVVAYENGKCTIYEVGGNVLNLSEEEGEAGVLNLPKTNAYANEIRYFTDCVKADVEPTKVRPEELQKVIEILKTI